MQNIIKELNKGRFKIGDKHYSLATVLLCFGCALVVVSCFLPLVTISILGMSQSVSLSNSTLDAIVICGLAIAAVIASYNHADKVSFGFTILLFVGIIFEIVHAQNSIASLSSDAMSLSGCMSIGYGVVVMLIGGCLGVIGGIAPISRKK